MLINLWILNMNDTTYQASGNFPNQYNFDLFNLNEQAEKRIDSLSVLKLCQESKINSVKPHHYFFDGLSPIIEKETKHSSRPKKFEHLTTEAKRQDKDIQALRKIKKQLKNDLMSYSYNNLPNSIVDLIVYSAKNKVPFDEINIPWSSFLNDSRLESLRKIYELTLLNTADSFSLPDQFEDFLNLTEMTHHQALINSGYNSDQNNKIEENLWNKREIINKIFQMYWIQETLNYQNDNISIQKFIIKVFSNKLTANNNGGLISLLKEKYSKDDTKLLGIVSKIILEEAKKQYEKYQKNHLLSFDLLKNFCIHSSKNGIISEISNELIKKNSISFMKDNTPVLEKHKIKCLDFILKEQKKHLITRFNNLVNYYTTFVNTINTLGNMAESFQPGGKNRVNELVNEILENSYFENEKRVTKNKKLMIVDTMAKTQMGTEKQKFLKDDVTKGVNILNFFLNSTSQEKQNIRTFERAHTLPFPTCFAWNSESIVNYLKKYAANFNKKYGEIFYNKLFFKKLIEQDIDSKTIEESLNKEFANCFEKYKPSNDLNEFIFQTLEIVHYFFLKLFSETEYLPDFINEIDNTCEWNRSKDYYQKTLATALKKLLEKQNECTKDNVIEELAHYFTETQKEVVEFYKKFQKEENSGVRQMKMIGLYQVEEALRTALHTHSNKDTIKKIFSSAMPV